MTAEKFRNKNEYEFYERYGDMDFRWDTVERCMRDFAKYHVEQALKEALESIPCLGSSTDIATYEEVEKAILKSYDLNNIT